MSGEALPACLGTWGRLCFQTRGCSQVKSEGGGECPRGQDWPLLEVGKWAWQFGDPPLAWLGWGEGERRQGEAEKGLT